MNYQRGRWNLNLQYTGTSSYEEGLFSPGIFTEVLFRFEGYHRVNASLGYTIPIRDQSSIELHLRGENLLNNGYVEDGFKTPGANAWAGIRYRFR